VRASSVPALLSSTTTDASGNTVSAPAADLALSTLAQLFGVPNTKDKTNFWTALPEPAAVIAKQLVRDGGVEVLLADLERRVSAAERALAGRETKAAADILHTATLSAACACVLNLCDRPRSILGLHAYGIDAFVRLFARACAAANAAARPVAAVPHLLFARAFGHYHSDMLYADVGQLGLEPATVRSQLKSAHEAHGDALLAALWPALFDSDAAEVRKHVNYARGFIDLFRHAGLGLKAAKRGGFARLFRECTDNTHSPEALSWLMLAVNNAARSHDIAAEMLEADAASLLTPALYHDDRNCQFQASLALSCLASHHDLRAQLEVSGCLDDMLLVLRSLSVFDLPTGLTFSESDVGAYEKLCDESQLKPVRHTGVLCLGWVAANYAKREQPETAVHLFQRTGSIDSLMKLARDSDAFIYTVAATALKLLRLPVPFYRERSKKAAGSHDSDERALAMAPDPLAWNVDLVCDWVGTHPFKVYRPAFRDCFVSGAVLASLSDGDLRDLGIANGVHRKAIRTAIAKLMLRAGKSYSHVEGLAVGCSPAGGAGTSDSNAAGGKEASAAAPAAPAPAPTPSVLLQAMPSLQPGNLLASYSEAYAAAAAAAAAAGVGAASGGAGALALQPTRTATSSLPALLAFTGVADSAASGLAPASTVVAPVDVFISYRRRSGAVLAQLLKVHLKMRGLTSFLDVETMGSGSFDVALQLHLSVARNVVVILSEGALDRCIDDHENKDYVRKEVALALAMQKNVVPVVWNFTWPEQGRLPADIRELAVRNAVTWSHEYQDASMDRVVRFLVR
jgi:hypothetical protein